MNEQEVIWTGPFGNSYNERNMGRVAANKAMLEPIMRCTQGVMSVLEFGCGTGENLEALRELWPKRSLAGVEINCEAADKAKGVADSIYYDSILTFAATEQWDMVLVKGLLIHIAPENLPQAYDAIYQHARHYILIAEYYSPKPVEIEYRGMMGMLWKRDFAGEMLERFSDLKLLNYGFAYHRDPMPQDDLNWFLLSKEAT